MATKRPKTVRVLRRWFTQNLGLKVLSLAAAIALFSLVRGGEDAQASVFVDVEPELPPTSSRRMLVSEVPDKVKLTLRGSRSLLESIRKEGLRPVEIDLRDMDRSYYYFDPEKFDVPAAVELVRLAPASIPLTWAKRVERRLPVEPKLSGSPGEGLRAEATDIEPARVTVMGPDTEVASLDAVWTEPVDVSERAVGRHRQRVPLEPPPAHTEFARSAVEVSIEVSREEAQRVLEGVQVTTRGPTNATVSPSSVDITLWGPEKALESMDPESVVPSVDLTDLTLDETDREVRIELEGLPPGVEGDCSPTSVMASVPSDAARVGPPGAGTN